MKISKEYLNGSDVVINRSYAGLDLRNSKRNTERILMLNILAISISNLLAVYNIVFTEIV